MESLHWDKNFETGLEEVDGQHEKLVALINLLNEKLSAKSGTAYADIEDVFAQLVAYTQYHFGAEEKMMEEVGLDARFVTQHIEAHLDFLNEVLRMHQGISPQDQRGALGMMSYLVHWLAFHILGMDKSMARQMAAIQAGQNVADIFLDEARINEKVIEPLLNALSDVFMKVSEQNRELLELNQSLELKVEARTRSLFQANKRLEEMALTDVLTGLPNRRHAMERLGREWEACTRIGAPLACMMIDADGFKQINDSYGHDAGDEVLRQLARQLRYAVRTDDVVCRLGGDEFLILCPNTPLPGAMHIAELLRKSIDALRVPAGTGEWKGSVSVGVAVRAPDMHSLEDLIKAADESVYAAKRNGRNRVACIQAGGGT